MPADSWTPNCDFYQDVYDDCNDLYLVTEWRKKINIVPQLKEEKKQWVTLQKKRVVDHFFYSVYLTKNYDSVLLA